MKEKVIYVAGLLAVKIITDYILDYRSLDAIFKSIISYLFFVYKCGFEKR